MEYSLGGHFVYITSIHSINSINCISSTNVINLINWTSMTDLPATRGWSSVMILAPRGGNMMSRDTHAWRSRG